MKNLPKEKRDRLVLILVGTIVSVVALWYGVITPQQKTIEKLARQAVDEDNKVNSAERLIASLPEMQRALQDSATKLQTIERAMASGDMYSWIIFTMKRFKDGYRVEIPQFSREIPCEVGVFPNFPYRAAAFNIRGTAYYHDFGRFLADFENTFPYIRVQNLEMEPVFNPNSASNASVEDPEKLNFRMEIVTLVNPHTP